MQSVAEALAGAGEPLAEAINHANADVRKCCVFALVEVHAAVSKVDKQAFYKEHMARLNPSQQKLVEIYIKRKIDQQDNKGAHSVFQYKI